MPSELGNSLSLSALEKLWIARTQRQIRELVLSDRELVVLASAKRVLEWFLACRSFRESGARAPLPQGVDERAFPVARSLAIEVISGVGEQRGLAATLLAHLRLLATPRRVKESDIQDAAFRVWRASVEPTILPKIDGRQSEPIPFAFELSDGCSAGCFFCSLSAPKVTRHFGADSREQRHFRSILNAAKDMAGASIAACPLYWASDPLDNPHYEVFADNFAAITGSHASISTALAPRYPERFKSLVDQGLTDPHWRVRVSIKSLRDLDTLFNSLTPIDTLFVDLVPLNEGTALPRVSSGRYMRALSTSPTLLAKEGSVRSNAGDTSFADRTRNGLGETNSCLVGLKINLVTGRVSLSSPCPASDAAPTGEAIHDIRTLGAAESLSDLAKRMLKDAATSTGIVTH